MKNPGWRSPKIEWSQKTTQGQFALSHTGFPFNLIMQINNFFNIRFHMTQSFLLLGRLTLEMGFLLCNPMLPTILRAHAIGSPATVSWIHCSPAHLQNGILTKKGKEKRKHTHTQNPRMFY